MNEATKLMEGPNRFFGDRSVDFLVEKEKHYGNKTMASPCVTGEQGILRLEGY